MYDCHPRIDMQTPVDLNHVIPLTHVLTSRAVYDSTLLRFHLLLLTTSFARLVAQFFTTFATYHSACIIAVQTTTEPDDSWLTFEEYQNAHPGKVSFSALLNYLRIAARMSYGGKHRHILCKLHADCHALTALSSA